MLSASAFSLYPLASSALNARVAPAARVEANGLFLLAPGSGGVPGPLAAGRLMHTFGAAAPLVAAAVATIAPGLIVAIGTARRQRRALAYFPSSEASCSSSCACRYGLESRATFGNDGLGRSAKPVTSSTGSLGRKRRM